MTAYREPLEDEGFSLGGEHSMRGLEGRSASVIGRDKESLRVVFLVSTPEESMTQVLLGFGEGMERQAHPL